MMKVFSLSSLLFLMLFGFAMSDEAGSNTVVDVVIDDPDLNDLEMAVVAAELVQDLTQLDPVAVFAPIDAAFASVDAKFLDPSWILHLQNILLFHTGLGDLPSDALMDNMDLIMLNDEILTVGVSGASVTLNGNFGTPVNVIATDLDATNGVVHKIDRVLLPDFVRRTIVGSLTEDLSSRFTKLTELVVAAGLEETVSTIDMTLLAPTNEAFDAVDPALLDAITNDQGMLTQVLLYHVIPGPDIHPSVSLEGCEKLMTTEGSNVFVKVLPIIGRVFFNFAEAFLTDVLAVNGIIHGINQVLIPPSVRFPECVGLDGLRYRLCVGRSINRNGD